MFLMINPFLILGIALLVIALIGGTIFLVKKANKGNKKIKIDAEFINNLVTILISIMNT